MANKRILQDMLGSLLSMPPRFHVREEWKSLVKQTVGRFARGNMSAQNNRILLPEEQALERETAQSLALKWQERYRRSKAA